MANRLSPFELWWFCLLILPVCDQLDFSLPCDQVVRDCYCQGNDVYICIVESGLVNCIEYLESS